MFLDKNQDGYVSKNEMVQAINETNAGERSSGMIAMKRFGQYSISLSFCRMNELFVSQFFHECLSFDVEVSIVIKLQLVFAEEMDWDKNGMVNYKEFLFAFTRWVGIDENDDEAD